EGAYLIGTESDPELRGQVAVVDAEKIGSFTVGLQCQLRLEHADVVAYVNHPFGAGEQGLDLARQLLEFVHIRTDQLDLDRVACSGATVVRDHQQLRGSYALFKVSRQLTAQRVGEHVRVGISLFTRLENGREANVVFRLAMLKIGCHRAACKGAFQAHQ